MLRACVFPECEHYAMHRVTTSCRRYDLMACHVHISWVVNHVDQMIGRWERIFVSTSSAVVVGDILAWRSRSITAYDELRQIGA